MATTLAVPSMSMQGIVVPAESYNPEEFFRRTRRLMFPVKTFTYAGLGQTDIITILQTGIIAGLTLRVSGTVTVALPTGTCASTARWPYDLVRAFRFAANGQSNLINVSGWKCKVHDFIDNHDLNDRGVAQGIGGASPGTSRTQGTLSLASESWGVGQNVTAIAANPYTFDLEYFIPVAYDQRTLVGAIFAQTASTDLTLAIDWAPVSDLFTLTGTATATVAATVVAEVVTYSIPQGPNGDVIVPDLTSYHSLISSRSTGIGNGVNEVRLPGQGVGRQLMRLYWQVWSGATPAPLPVNATNVGQVGWRFGGNDTPEVITDGQHVREWNERTFCCDLGAFGGFAVLDWCNDWALRDSIDEGAATDIRIVHEIPAAVVLTNPAMEFVQETVFAAAAGA